MRVFYCGCKLVCLVGDGIDFGRTTMIHLKSVRKYYIQKKDKKNDILC